MAVKLRLRRMGKKKQPIYKIVAADSRSPRDGKFIEAVGLYNPLTKPHTIEVKEERVTYWLGKGAQPTLTVKSLLKQKGIIYKLELQKKGLSEEAVSAELEKWAAAKGAKKVAKKQAKPVVKEEVKAEAVVEPKVEEKAEEIVKEENTNNQESTPEA